MRDPGPASTQSTLKKRGNGGTFASSVHQELLDEILSGRLKPGNRLFLEPLRERFGVGNSPIREALNRLAATGFVVAEDQKGFRVAPADAADLSEIISARCALEEFALRESIRLADQDWEERVLLSHHRLACCAVPAENSSATDRLNWETNHRKFHLTLISACSSRHAIRFCAELQHKMLRYRNLSSASNARPESAAREHREICDAALGRDADRTVELIYSHLKSAEKLNVAVEASEDDC